MTKTYPFRICIVTNQYKSVKSGIGTYSKIMTDRLKNDYKVTIMCSDKEITPEKDIKIISINQSKIDPTPHKWVSFSYNVAKKIKDMQEEFDIIHFADAREALFYSSNKLSIGNINDYYYATASKNPFYYKDYGDWLKRYFYCNFVFYLEKIALSHLSIIIPNSDYVSKIIKNNYNISEDRIYAIHKSVDYRRFGKKSEIKKETFPIILFVGGNFFRKGLPSLIKATPEVIKKFPNTLVYIIGKDKNEKKIVSLCKKYNVIKNYKFLDWVSYEKIVNYYKIADVFVMPSLIEAFGIVFLEAMAAGVPVIGGNVGGTKELIQNEENGLLVNPNDHKKIASSIIRLLENNVLRKKIIENGYKTIKKYSAESMVSKTIELYRNLSSHHISEKSK